MVKYPMKSSMKINRFGDRLRQARENKEMSQEEISKLLGISQQRYSPWEAGKDGKQIEPPYDFLSRISEILGASIEWLVRGSGELGEKALYPKHDQKIMVLREQFEKYGYDSVDAVIDLIPQLSKRIQEAKGQTQDEKIRRYGTTIRQELHKMKKKKSA